MLVIVLSLTELKFRVLTASAPMTCMTEREIGTRMNVGIYIEFLMQGGTENSDELPRMSINS